VFGVRVGGLKRKHSEKSHASGDGEVASGTARAYQA
jgi:hypothetical protein